jgi:hypothetical protein
MAEILSLLLLASEEGDRNQEFDVWSGLQREIRCKYSVLDINEKRFVYKILDIKTN